MYSKYTLKTALVNHLKTLAFIRKIFSFQDISTPITTGPGRNKVFNLYCLK